MKNNRIRILAEGAMSVALAWVVDFLCALIPTNALFVFGGSVSVGMVPIIFYTYRNGTAAGITAALAFSGIQLLNFSPPPAGTALALVLCLLLDYVLAYGVVGLANLFATPFSRHRLVGFAVGGGAVCLLRFVCSFFSGVILWGSFAPEGMNVWLYSLIYNGSYMLTNAVLTAAVLAILCRALDPKTLRPAARS